MGAVSLYACLSHFELNTNVLHAFRYVFITAGEQKPTIKSNVRNINICKNGNKHDRETSESKRDENVAA